MQGMDPETGFMPEAKKLFGDEEIVYIKSLKAGNPSATGWRNGRDAKEKD